MTELYIADAMKWLHRVTAVHVTMVEHATKFKDLAINVHALLDSPQQTAL